MFSNNNNIAPSAKLNILPTDKKQLIILTGIQRQIKQQDYVNKMYLQDIQILIKQKQQLQRRFQYWDRQGPQFKKTWEYINHSNLSILTKNDKNGYMREKIMKNSTMKLDQSVYFGQSASRLSDFVNKKNESPIRKLKLMNKSQINESGQKYNKLKQLQGQISQIEQKIKDKYQKCVKIKEQKDEISQNLLKKVQQQEIILRSQIQKWKQLHIKQNIQKQLIQKITKIKQQLFRQKQGIKTIKYQSINQNKQIIKKGYTQKMLHLIAAYGGTRN